MKKLKIVSGILAIVGIFMISIALVVNNDISLKANRKMIFKEINMQNVATSANMVIDSINKDNKETNPVLKEIDMEVVPASVVVIPIEEKTYETMTLEERAEAYETSVLELRYSEVYPLEPGYLTKSRGVVYFDGHKETYYSERVLPGTSLNIPGRHVADDGTIRDADGYICVAADPEYLSKGSVVMTSLGPAKVYDCGCAYGTVDIYVNW